MVYLEDSGTRVQHIIAVVGKHFRLVNVPTIS